MQTPSRPRRLRYDDTASFSLSTGKVKAEPDVSTAVLRGWSTEHLKGS